MSTLIVVLRTNEERTIDATDDASIKDAIVDAGIDELLALCGGSCACATCHVYVDEGRLAELDPMGRDETELLAALDHNKPNSRLSCQIRMRPPLAGLRVKIAPEE